MAHDPRHTDFATRLRGNIGVLPPLIAGNPDALIDLALALDAAITNLIRLIPEVSATRIASGGSSSTRIGGGGSGGGITFGESETGARIANVEEAEGGVTVNVGTSQGDLTPSEVTLVQDHLKILIKQREDVEEAFQSATGKSIGESLFAQSFGTPGSGGPSIEQLMLELQTAALLGFFEDGTPTLAGRQFDFLMDSWLAEQVGVITLPDGTQVPSLDRTALIAQLTGMMLGPDGPVRTLNGLQFDELIRAAQVSEEMQLAGMTGFLRGERTVAGISLDEAIRSNAARETLTALGQLETVRANRAGEVLAREGNQINAIGQQLAARARLGDLTLRDADQRLANIDTAFTQRRAELVQAAPFAVNPDDVFESESGQLLVDLPLAGSIGALLTLAGVPGVGEDFGTVPIFNTNPDAVGQAVLDASAFDSPVPGLAAATDAADIQFAELFSQPISGGGDTSEALLGLLGG